ncbi:O-antigen ligase domain-containing protein [Bradyrhizobium guangdongense]|nr:O-antigen ligase domain-containing protein [Bradyrhizobium guangdongense]
MLFGTVALAPLPFGSTDLISIALWCVVLGIAIVLGPVDSFDGGHATAFGVVFALALAYSLVLHEQLADKSWLPVGLVHPIWTQASEVLGTSLAPSISVAKHQPFFELGRPLANILIFLAGLRIGADRRASSSLLKVIAWSGVAYAVYGIGSHIIDPGKVLWREKVAYQGVLTATFFNRNTAAVYFGTCAIAWLVLLLGRLRYQIVEHKSRWRSTLRSLLSHPPHGSITASLALFVCLSAMFMTGSRAGVLLSLTAAVIVFTAYLGRVLPRGSRVAALFVVAGCCVFLLFQLLGGVVNARIDLQGLGDGGRLHTYKAMLGMIESFPWLGTGLGTFVWSFPAYRPSDVSLWGVWDRAHSTILEIASDVGVPLAILVVVAWILMLGLLVNALRRSRGEDTTLLLAALAAAFVALVHTSLDFSLQTFGFSATIFALQGAAVGRAFRVLRKNSPSIS